MTNINPKTGIAYGYISAQSLDNDVVDNLMYGSQAIDLSYEPALDEYMEEQKTAWIELEGNLNNFPYDDLEEEFAHTYETSDEPIIEGELDGVKYRTSWLGGALNFWIFESPHVGHFQQCSPCVPGAANLDQPCEDGIKGYDVPAGWRYPNMEMQDQPIPYAGVTVWVGDKRCSHGVTKDELELSTFDVLQAAFDHARRVEGENDA